MIKKIIEKIKILFFSCKKNNYQPDILKPNFLFFLVLAFFILRLTLLPFYAYFSNTVFFAKIVSLDLISLLNEQRMGLGLGTLKESKELDQAALLKAQDMINNDYFGHKSPEGITGWFFVEETGYDYQMAGENLAIGFLDSDEVHQAWNNSASHKANLLNPNFEEIGIAVLKGNFEGQETTVVVQLFGKPKQVQEVQTLLPIQPTQPNLNNEENLPKELTVPAVKPAQTAETVEPVKPAKNAETTENQETESKPLISQQQEEKLNPENFMFNLWQFLISKQNKIVQKLIFGTGFAVSFILMLNLFVIAFSSINLQQKLVSVRNVALPALLTVLILISLGLFDKLVILQLIPHNLAI